MNSTGIKLNDQELRNASFYGEFKTLAFNLGNENYDYWIKWKLFTNRKVSRMEEVEFVNDLLIHSIDGTIRRTPEKVDNYYKNYDNEDSIPNRELIIKRIRNFIEFLDDTFGEYLKKYGLNKTPLLYSIFALIYENEFRNTRNVSIKLNKKKFKETLISFSIDIKKSREEWKQNRTVSSIPERVYDAFTRGTNTKDNRKTVFNYIEKLLY